MKALKLLPLLALLFPAMSFGQNQANIWYFGNNAGLDFNSGSPEVLMDGQTQTIGCPACHAEGTAVMADSQGRLLFYCDGRTLWNRNHDIMLNGDSLLSNISSTQSSLILPLPGSSRYFYVFTTADSFFNNLQNGFRYSIVDMCLDGGLGGVISGEKNIFLLGNACEKLTAVRHANGMDYWVITHKFQSDAFHAFHLSNLGIVNEVVSNVGSIHTSSPSTGGAQGQLKASPNGEKLAAVNGGAVPGIAEYFDFDKNSGEVSNAVSIQSNPAYNYFGVSFSPDNSKLYIACTLNGNGIYQFDLSAEGGDPAAVMASQTQIADTYNFLGLQLATDGKIYVARSPFGFNPYLDVINEPNNAGTSCNYVESTIYLNGNSASYGFPNFVDSFDYDNTIHDCVTTTDINDAQIAEIVAHSPNPFSSHLTLKTAYTNQAVLTLFNMYGEEICSTFFTEEITLDTVELPDGMYIYQITGDQRVITRGTVIKR